MSVLVADLGAVMHHAVYWGGHGCDLSYGHEEPCRCIHTDENGEPWSPWVEDSVLTRESCPFGDDVATAIYGEESNE